MRKKGGKGKRKGQKGGDKRRPRKGKIADKRQQAKRSKMRSIIIFIGFLKDLMARLGNQKICGSKTIVFFFLVFVYYVWEVLVWKDFFFCLGRLVGNLGGVRCFLDRWAPTLSLPFFFGLVLTFFPFSSFCFFVIFIQSSVFIPNHNNKDMEQTLKGRKRTEDVLIADGTEQSFADLLLPENILQGLLAAGFERPSPVQLQAIPLGRFGVDVIAQAKSGTGKTVVFSVIALDSVVLSNTNTQVLVVAPTREVANQIEGVIQTIGKRMDGLRCGCFIGGTSTVADKKKVKGCQIAVGTPGRLQALMENGSLKTEALRTVIIDEADKLLDEKFESQLRQLLESLPQRKQILAFSATFEDRLLQEMQRFMRNPKIVDLCVGDVKLKGVTQYYCRNHSNQNLYGRHMKKSEILKDVLDRVSFNQCLVFCNDHLRGTKLVESLSAVGWPCGLMSGSQSQAERNKVMESFRELSLRILVCSDLIARGVDIERVNLVVNIDLPRDAETYMHRVGRTGRFGTYGVAISLVNTTEFKLLKKFQTQYDLQLADLPSEIPSILYEYEGNEGEDQSEKRRDFQMGTREKRDSNSVPGSPSNPQSEPASTSVPQTESVRAQPSSPPSNPDPPSVKSPPHGMHKRPRSPSNDDLEPPQKRPNLQAREFQEEEQCRISNEWKEWQTQQQKESSERRERYLLEQQAWNDQWWHGWQQWWSQQAFDPWQQQWPHDPQYYHQYFEYLQYFQYCQQQASYQSQLSSQWLNYPQPSEFPVPEEARDMMKAMICGDCSPSA